jgi:hypothetical protein
MAVFRAVTAEEEAATSLIYALHRHKYAGAGRIHGRDHRHKAAILPFLRVIVEWFARMEAPPIQVYVETVGELERLNIQLEITLPDGTKRLARPDQPFNGEIRPAGLEQQADLSREIEALANPENLRRLRETIDERANLRNQILFAAVDGLPNVQLDADRFLHNKATDVFTLLTLFLLVDQYREQQMFVTQVLGAFVPLIQQL